MQHLLLWICALLLVNGLWGVHGAVPLFSDPALRNLKLARMMQRRVDIDCTASCKEDNGRLEKVSCVQKCSSPICYDAIIAQELEEGEVDTRESRFKNCLVDDLRRRKTARDIE